MNYETQSFFRESPDVAGLTSEFYRPTLREVCSRFIGDIRSGYLLLGVNPIDDKAVYLSDVYGGLAPTLVIGDSQAGKTGLLKTLASSIELQNYGRTQPDAVYAVLTQTPDEWGSRRLPSAVGISSPEDGQFANILSSLRAFNGVRGMPRPVLLLIDGFGALNALDMETRREVKKILKDGISERIQVVATNDPQIPILNAGEWSQYFATKIFGHIEDSFTANALTKFRLPAKNHAHSIGALADRGSFAYAWGDELVPFWTPRFDETSQQLFLPQTINLGHTNSDVDIIL